MSTQRLLLDSYLKTLKLPTMRAEYEAIARKCSQANAAYEDYLQQLAELEVQRRTAMGIERRLKQAEFPIVKEMSSYRFADVPKLNKKYVLDLARCQFIETRTNLVLTGSPEVGKTDLAIAFGREACKRGFKVKFFTASQLLILSELRKMFNHSELPSLKKLLLSKSLIKRKQAATIVLCKKGLSHRAVADTLISNKITVAKYWRNYEQHSLDGFTACPRRPRKADDVVLHKALLALLHSPPSSHGINRTRPKTSEVF